MSFQSLHQTKIHLAHSYLEVMMDSIQVVIEGTNNKYIVVITLITICSDEDVAMEITNCLISLGTLECRLVRKIRTYVLLL